MSRRDAPWLVFFAVLLLFAFGDVWLTGRVQFARDITYLFHPMHAFTAESLQAGRLPLWNPYMSGGVFWMGEPQTGLLSPGNLVFWLFPFVPAFTLFQFLHFFLSGLGGYLLVRSMGGHPGVAVLSALLWSLNGFWRARAEFPPLLAALTWIPWMVLAVRRLPRALSGGTVLLGLVMAFAVAAGHPPHALWGVVLLLLWTAAQGELKRKGFSIFVAGGIALLVTAAQGFCTIDLASRSVRVAGLDPAASAFYSFTPRHLGGLLLPWLSAMKEHAYSGEKYFWLGCFYVGLGGGVLAGAAFFLRKGSRAWVWPVAFLFGALMALGLNGPLYGPLQSLPVLSWLRFPGQHALWMTAACLFVIARGAVSLGRVLRGPRLWGAVAVVSLELIAYGRALAPALTARYFRARPGWIETVERGPRAPRLFLSPRAAGTMNAQGDDWEEAWTRQRLRLLSMGTVPYHVRNLSPFGFALQSRDAARLLEGLYAAPSLDAAREGLSRLGVRWIAAPEPLSGVGLVQRARDPWFLYEIPAGEPGELYDPGWRAYENGRPVPLENDGGLLRPAAGRPLSAVRLVFRPGAFRIGLLLSVLSLAGMGVWALRVRAWMLQ